MNHEGAMMTPLWSYFYLLLQFMLSLPDFIARLMGPPLSTLAVLKQGFFKQIEHIRSGSNPSIPSTERRGAIAGRRWDGNYKQDNGARNLPSARKPFDSAEIESRAKDYKF
jgi:hypothetical protein